MQNQKKNFACNKNSPLNSWENDKKSFWKNSKGKGTNQRKRRKVVATAKEPNIQSTLRYPKNMVAAMNLLRQVLFSSSFLLLSLNKYSLFSFFFGPCAFVQGVFSLFDEFIMYVFMDSTLKKFTDTNSLNDAESNNATQHNFQCKQIRFAVKNSQALDVLMGLQRLQLFIDYSPKQFFPEILRLMNDFKKLFSTNFKLMLQLYQEHRKKISQVCRNLKGVEMTGGHPHNRELIFISAMFQRKIQ